MSLTKVPPMVSDQFLSFKEKINSQNIVIKFIFYIKMRKYSYLNKGKLLLALCNTPKVYIHPYLYTKRL